MKNKKRGKYWAKKGRLGSMIATYNLLEYSPFPKPIFGIKASTTEKDKGMMMIDAIQHNFSINDVDIEEFRKEMKEKEEQDFYEMEQQAKEIDWKDPPAKFKRDEDGNIISPFASKKKLV